MAGLGGIGGFGGLGGMNSQAQQQQEQMRLMEMMQEMQVADSLRMYNELVQRCFGHCVENFRSRKLDGKEEACIVRCCQKFLKFTQRATQRFQEHQQEMAEEAAKAQQNK
ncbi:Mitochondrial import inner membrane translocase subunit Tim9 [Gracilariopsis chorda]|uniref:Mitochondrial import inner membrane translocase subunit n=1 Tax=Gracilariopsis chorda TaxID=448386 RepID=A0A2V3J2Q6_9FLOR|nr:Mitochondrial import inner membrane translocase subunit Tim9 [Gracilariopsis chorda]|eukprot:PXF48277.1 Mitochondrial import inner membrane translocase subunit Tim9 [Gracilariopsis chorda]